MNRKLHNTMLAMSTTGVLFLVGLMVATPSVQPSQAPLASRLVHVGPLVVRVEVPAGQEAAARVRTLDLLIGEIQSGRPGDGQAAEVRTQALVGAIADSALLAAYVADGAGNQPVAETDEASRGKSHHVRRARAALALPYFSFAQGLRRNRS